jgi:trehalose utilization protein
MRVTVWNENIHEQTEPEVARLYPDGIHGAVASAVRGVAAEVRTATLDEPEHGLTDETLANTDVLVWWGHIAHDRVDDNVAGRVKRHVLAGMGLVVLHSGHFSKIFKLLMGTTCALTWRDSGARELLWTVKPSHPVARGIPNPVVIPAQEAYCEPFDIPEPEELVFISSFGEGQVLRSGCAYHRGHGRVFYFGPGDQKYPVYHQPEIRQVIANAARWAAGERRPRELAQLRHGAPL